MAFDFATEGREWPCPSDLQLWKRHLCVIPEFHRVDRFGAYTPCYIHDEYGARTTHI